MKSDGPTPDWFSISLCLLIAVFVNSPFAGAASTQGTEFLVVFQESISNGNNTLYITTERDEVAFINVTLRGKVTISSAVSRSSPALVSIPLDLRMTGTNVSANFTIEISSTHPVSVFAELAIRYSTDATLVLPVSELGTHYVLASYTPFRQAQAVMVATQANTTVQLYKDGERLEHLALLQRLEAFQLQSDEDLMGTEVVADKPIAVFSGNKHTRVVERHNAWDHLYVQLVPMSSWGSHFVTFPTMTAQEGQKDKYRIVASQANTTVNVTGERPFTLTKPTEWREVALSAWGLFTISSNAPVMVVKFVSGNTTDSHPCMALLVPTNQWSSSYAFYTPLALPGMLSDIWILSYSDKISDIQVNGEALKLLKNHNCSLQVLDQDGHLFKACRLRFKANTSVIMTSSPDTIFGAYSFSFGGYVASCHALGMDLNGPQNRTHRPPPASPFQLMTPLRTGPDATLVSVAPTNLIPQPLPTSASLPACSCTLRCHYGATKTASNSEISSAVERLRSELVVATKSLSASRRKVASAPDGRVSSQAFGYVGIGVVVLIFSVIVLLDLQKLTRDIVQALKRGSQ